MPVLQQRDRETIERRFAAELKRDVRLKLYTQPVTRLFIPGRECPSCGPTQELLGEVSELSRRVSLEVVDYYKNQEDASSRGIEKIPALVVSADGRDNVRFYGMPSGYEFAMLLDSIVAASHKASSLQLETRRQLKALSDDVHIQVFVTPTCPYCPTLGQLAYAMALESSCVTADVVEIQEFPYLARLYNVMSVPKTVINGNLQFTGAMSEEVLLKHVLEAVGAIEPEEGVTERFSDQTTRIS